MAGATHTQPPSGRADTRAMHIPADRLDLDVYPAGPLLERWPIPGPAEGAAVSVFLDGRARWALRLVETPRGARWWLEGPSCRPIVGGAVARA